MANMRVRRHRNLIWASSIGALVLATVTCNSLGPSDEVGFAGGDQPANGPGAGLIDGQVAEGQGTQTGDDGSAVGGADAVNGGSGAGGAPPIGGAVGFAGSGGVSFGGAGGAAAGGSAGGPGGGAGGGSAEPDAGAAPVNLDAGVDAGTE